ncbi:MAG: hypothetical protein COA78_34425 [Blastopirellula sp.]|nr:MAG: hypothetical protein COA78_34425 [Blastopirellula sp.]
MSCMYTYLFNRMIFIGLVSLILQVEVYAASSELPWEVWFRNQILKHPAIIAAREEMNSAFSFADGRERPLYNPQINSELEREGIDNNFRVGINQTIDLRNKLGTRREQATYSRIAAQQAFELIVQEKSAEALAVLVDWQGATEQAALALAQEEQLTTLLLLVEERLGAGDLSQIDAELSILNLSQRLNATAQALARLAEAEASIRELLPEWSPERADVPEEFWQINNTNQFAQLLTPLLG